MLRVCVSGIGRSGSQVAKYLLGQKQVKLVSAICSDSNPHAGCDLGTAIDIADTGVTVYPAAKLDVCLAKTRPHVVIDFSGMKPALHNIRTFAEHHVRIVMAVTGFTETEQKRMNMLVRKHGTALLYAPNITRGVNVMMLLSELAGKLLADYDPEILEMHHKHKCDAPSGTAKKLAGALENAYAAVGSPKNIPVSAVRAGGIIGEHAYLLVGENDMLEIRHRSLSRDAFAEGALFAARFIQDKIGIYEMKDALHFEESLAEYGTISDPLADADILAHGLCDYSTIGS